MKRARGFTLLEMLVVLGVFAVVGVISAQLVQSTLSNHETMNERGARLAEIQRAMMVMSRDILQLSDRGVRDILGDPVG
ncbi:MAG: prepilin-type N-terminal cleavage/methylation domain-containing protein, partial [Proteobacteria bacterium]|nr:prepilin-type N-terminal cleavage/methylation domain-containing protein [Pseudomonadota bacterium]